MSKESNAIDTIDRLLVQYEGLKEAAATLREVGSQKAMVESLKTQATAAQAELDKAKKERDAAAAATKTAKFQADAALAQATTDAAKILKDADTKAAAIVAKSAETAANETAAEKAGRESRLKTLQGQIDAAAKRLKELEEANAKATQEALAIERRTKAAQDSLEKVQATARALAGA